VFPNAGESRDKMLLCIILYVQLAKLVPLPEGYAMRWLFSYFKTITYSVFALSGTAVYGEIRSHDEIENALVLSFCDVLVHKNKAKSCIFAP
jgi:hypothetical protein